jgi:RNA:NAD 2'-phosphotransferase (TPT1/KptA family)
MPDEIYEEASDRELDRLARGGAENPNDAECTALREDIISQVHRCRNREVLAEVLRVFEVAYNADLKEMEYARVTRAVEGLATAGVQHGTSTELITSHPELSRGLE